MPVLLGCRFAGAGAGGAPGGRRLMGLNGIATALLLPLAYAWFAGR